MQVWRCGTTTRGRIKGLARQFFLWPVAGNATPGTGGHGGWGREPHYRWPARHGQQHCGRTWGLVRIREGGWAGLQGHLKAGAGAQGEVQLRGW